MMRRYIEGRHLCLILCLIVCLGSGLQAEEKRTYKKVDMNIDVNKEDKEVGIKRMEIIEKALSQDLIEKKRSLVQKLEGDYDRKIKALINSIIPPIYENKVMTHIDVNFFAPDFESQVRSSQKAAVSVILKRDGFESWAKQNESDQGALKMLKQMIGTTFRIPDDRISILIVN